MNYILSSAALAATAVPAVAAGVPITASQVGEADPVILAIERQAKVWAEFTAAYDEADRLEELAVASGAARRPFALVAWRRYSHIGGGEIEKARDEFLCAGIPPEVVEREYQQVRKNYLAIIEDQRQWDAGAGIPAGLRERVDFLRTEGWRLRDEMARTNPTTLVGAAALAAEAAKAFDEDSEDDWQFVAMRTVAAAGGASLAATPRTAEVEAAAVSPDTQLLDLAYQWRDAMEEWNNCGWDPIDDHPAGEQASQLEHRMDEIEPETLHGWAVKTLVLTSFGDFSFDNFTSVIDDAVRLTGFTRWPMKPRTAKGQPDE